MADPAQQLVFPTSEVGQHHRSRGAARSELDAAKRAGGTMAADRMGVLSVVLTGGDEGANIREIQDSLYRWTSVRSQEDLHRISAKINKVATRCLELEDLGLIENRYDRGQRVCTLTADGRESLAYWATDKGRTTWQEQRQGLGG